MSDTTALRSYLQRLSALELATLQHEARRLGDAETVQAVLDELKRRAG